MFDLNRAMTWPLRPIGLDPGRALTNARPSSADQQAQRADLWNHIQERFRPPEVRTPRRHNRG